jgi:phosphate starvation-inducible PhoH-like protein
MSRRPRLRLASTEEHDLVSRVRGKKARRQQKMKAIVQETGQGCDNPHKWERDIKARSEGQRKFLEAIDTSDITFGLGPAGTGKTYLAVCKAVEAFEAGKVKRIVLTRPAVEAGERIGFLPGDLKEKMDPYMRPIYDALYQRMPWQKVASLIAEKAIEIAPIAFLRGRTLAHSAIILDEAQNATYGQLRMVVTRLGLGSFMIVTGDPDQSDLDEGDSGLERMVNMVEGIHDRISVVRLNDIDVVRHPVVQSIVRVL